MTNCFNCKTEFRDLPNPVGRRDTCEKCGADIHVCKNCGHYDIGSYNDCREPMAERVVDKEKSNFCDYFILGTNKGANAADAKSSALKALDDLFKK